MNREETGVGRRNLPGDTAEGGRAREEESIHMKMRLALILSAFAVLLLTTAPSQAASSSGRYVGGTFFGAGGTTTVSQAQTGFAGYTFTTLSFAPKFVKIVDDTAATDIEWAVCQDVDPLPCGAGQDRYQSGCSSGGKQALAGFTSGRTVVFVGLTSLDCEGNATTGTITLSDV